VGTDIRPFLNDIPQADLDDLLERLSRTCWPDEVRGVGSDHAALRWTTSRTCWSIGPLARSSGPGKQG
jgi:hypothetical protein